MLVKKFLQTIRNLIAKGQLKDAIGQLLMVAETESLSEYNDLLLLSAKYHDLEKMELDNRISFENHQTDANKLLRSLIAFVDIFEKALPEEVAKPVSPTMLSDIYKASIARAKVIEVLVAATDKGLTIKAIYQLSGLKYRKYIIAALDELIGGEIVERYRLEGESLNRLGEGKRGLVKRWF